MCSPGCRSGRGTSHLFRGPVRPPHGTVGLSVGPIPGSVWPGGETGGMAFGQQAGPPASRREVQELLTLLQDAGHTDFRDARGPVGFTRDKAAAFNAQP